jgi:hypothetical protein
MPSLSSYDRGKKEMEGRRYLADIEAGNTAFAVLNQALTDLNNTRRRTKHAGWHPERYILRGNHEDRIMRAVSMDAQLDGVLSYEQFNDVALGWIPVPFLDIKWLDGIAYSHYFYNPMTGKPLGGTVDARLKTIGHSFTMGHQQTLAYSLRYVAGKSQHGLVAGACYLHDEDYKGPQGNAHFRGIIVKHEVEEGSYCPMFISLDYLSRRYEGMRLAAFMKKKYGVTI